MIYGNPTSFEKLVERDYIRKNSVENKKNIIKSIIFRQFKIFSIKNNVFYFIRHD